MKNEHDVNAATARTGTDARPGRVGRAPPRYSVAAVKSAPAPDRDDASEWCSYVLENGRSTITGRRRGSVQQVTEHATRYADELNARSGGQSTLGWIPRRGR
ncbi:MAG TPA: hypothetical protein VKA76_11220 [Gammaproteobacteria bacterium]|nr:hypothetical protein [Gammaproteobacteria bacterium]